MKKLKRYVLIAIAIVLAVTAGGIFGAFTVSKKLVLQKPLGDILVPSPTLEITPSAEVVVKEIKKMAKLQVFSKIYVQDFVGKKNAGKLWGLCEEGMTLEAHVEVFAGVDLENLTKDDIKVIDSDNITVYLPPAEILVVDMINEQTLVKDAYQAIFAGHDPGLETEIRKYAERYIETHAVEADDVLKQANDNAKTVVKSILQMLGFENVEFSDKPLNWENGTISPEQDYNMLDLTP